MEYITKVHDSENILNILISNIDRLFVYWNISDEYNKKFLDKFGDDFFEKTKECLIIKNLTKGQEELIEIKEPTNNYYIKFRYSNSIYQVELVRLGKKDDMDYGYKIISNKIQSPSIKIQLNRYSDDNIILKNIDTLAKVTDKNICKENVVGLYNELIIPYWNKYKKENSYRE